MAYGIQVIRGIQAKNAASEIGFDPRQPSMTVSQQAAKGGGQSALYAMPQDVGAWKPLQVIDVASADFGKFYFLPGYSVVGGADVIL